MISLAKLYYNSLTIERYNKERTMHERGFHTRYSLFFAAGIALLLLMLSYRITLGTPEVDRMILASLHSLRTETLDTFFKAVTWLGSIKVLLPLYLILLWWIYHARYGKRVFTAASVLLLSFATTSLLKYYMARPRPDFFPDRCVSLPLDPSFPSGHTTQAFGFVLTLWLLFYVAKRPLQPALLFLLLTAASIVGLSRLYLQVHFPTDVTAGILVPLFWTSLLYYFLTKETNPHEK
jgi:undecaprenyl-diphosphatase